MSDILNESESRKNQLRGLRRFGKEKPAIPGPGRPPLPPQVKADREEAKRILNENSARAALRLSQLIDSEDEDVAIKASDGILKRTVPVLEEVTNHDDRPLQQLTDEQINAKLAEIRSSRNGTHSGNGVSAQ